MAAGNRCQSFYWLRIYHLTTWAICAPHGLYVPPPEVLIIINEGNRSQYIYIVI